MTSLTELPLSCPQCHADLSISKQGAQCSSCSEIFPRVFKDIIDLRFPRPEANEGIQRLTQLLINAYSTTSFNDLAQLLIDNFPHTDQLPENISTHYREYFQTNVTRGHRMIEMFRDRLARNYSDSISGKTALDIGCGSGASIQLLSHHYDLVIGLDPELTSLILAHKNMQEQGIHNVHLVQAFGQNMPFWANSFNYISALNVLEHVFDIDLVAAEIKRTLSPNGVFVADSRNRFDLFYPEPHVKLYWVGFLPRRWAVRYVRWRTGIEYNHTYLLSYFDLYRTFQKYFPQQFKIHFPGIVAYGGPPWGDQLLQRIEKVPGLSTIMLLIFPSHLIVARKTLPPH